MKYIDVHSHISFPAYDKDRGEVLKRMQRENVGAITVGVDLESSHSAVSLADKEDALYATVGLHPNNTSSESFTPEDYKKLASHPKTVAIGECGLDYYRNDPDDAHVKKQQRDAFAAQIDFALAADMPLMLHCRPSKGSMDAYEETLSILKSYTAAHGEKLRGDTHFFVGTKDIASQFIALNFTLSFTGVVTFAGDYDEVIKYVPSDMILSETDAPYVTPEPHRGKRNEPTYVVNVVERLAQIRDVSLEPFKSQLMKNAKRVFSF